MNGVIMSMVYQEDRPFAMCNYK